MSTIIVAVIVLSVIFSIVFFLVFISRRHNKKKLQHMMNRFSQAGSRYQLSFSSHAILKNCVIGVDGISRKLLVMESDKEQESFQLINLDQVIHCSLNSQYQTIDGGNKGNSPEKYLEFVELKFSYKDSQDSYGVRFYDHIANHIYEIAELEAKAKDWETMLSKLIMGQVSKRA